MGHVPRRVQREPALTPGLSVDGAPSRSECLTRPCVLASKCVTSAHYLLADGPANEKPPAVSRRGLLLEIHD